MAKGPVAQVLVNGAFLPIDGENPIKPSFELSTDDFLGRGLEPGIVPDNEIEAVMVPWTSEVADALGEYAMPGHRQDDPLLPAAIFDDTSAIFQGFAVVQDIIYERGRPTKALLDFRAGATSILDKLKQVNLRRLELGTEEFTKARQEASWAGGYDFGDRAVWAPVVYGEMDPLDPGNFPVDTLRPHVYFRAIIDGIAAALGVRFVSTFFDLPFFKNHVYLFGVGEQWKLQGPTSRYVRASAPAGATTASLDSFLFTDESTGLNEDQDGVWDGEFYTPGVADWYEIEVAFTLSTTGYIAFVEVDNGGLVSNYPLFTGGGIVGPFFIGPSATVRVVWQPIPGNPNATMTGGSVFYGRRFGNPAIGSQVELASCLHDRNAFDFLAGLKFMFNLAFAYHPALNEIHVEPRFDYEIDGIAYPGFYASLGNAANPAEDWTEIPIGESLTMIRDLPFGSYLSFKNRTEDSEITKILQRSGSAAAPLMGFRYEFTARDVGGGSILENPYFEDLYFSEDFDHLYLPLVMPGFVPADGPKAPDYISEPKYGYYAGYLPLGTWKHDGVSQTFLPYVAGKPIITTSGPAFPFSASMGDHLNNAGFGRTTVPGYGSIFWKRYLDLIRNSVRIEFTGLAPESVVSQLSFRRPKIMDIGTGPEPYILVRVEGYQPGGRELCRLVLVRATADVESLTSNFVHDTRRNGYDPFFS